MLGKGSIVPSENGYILCGQTDDEKASNPSDGSFWKSGLISSINYNTEINWQQTISLSDNYDDYYRSIDRPSMVSQNYAVGTQSNYVDKEGNFFGYGLISCFDDYGSNFKHKSIGNKNYSSKFNDLLCPNLAEPKEIIAVGKTEQKNNSSSKAWLVLIDMTKFE